MGIFNTSYQKLLSILALHLCCISPLFSQNITPYANGPIHEAFVTPINGDLFLEAVPKQPPEPISERIPRQVDMQAEWIPGYWAWEEDLEGFVWVSGVWRRPPPGHLWISGFWKNYEEGWVWINGFWNRVSENNLQYIGIDPPEALDEDVPAPPNDNYTWAPGYWLFSFPKQEYEWVPGHWEQMDPNWIYVPPHYVFRPGGYVFISSYWDWPLDERGTAYEDVRIPDTYGYQGYYEPSVVIEPTIIIERLYADYPDYLFLFHHHYHYHHDYWEHCGCAPVWWGWDTWWGYTWQDQWALWWWYTHPGYPQPYWMTAHLSSILPAPDTWIYSKMKKTHPPAIVTKKGVVSKKDLRKAMTKRSGKFSPILPGDKTKREKVYDSIKWSRGKEKEVLKPSGKKLPLDTGVVRPHVRKPVINEEEIKKAPVLKEGKRPKLPTKPKIPAHKGPKIWEEERGKEAPAIKPPIRKPTWTPRTPQERKKVEIKPKEVDTPRMWEKKPESRIRPPIQRPSMPKSEPREIKTRERRVITPQPIPKREVPEVRQRSIPQEIKQRPVQVQPKKVSAPRPAQPSYREIKPAKPVLEQKRATPQIEVKQKPVQVQPKRAQPSPQTHGKEEEDESKRDKGKGRD